MVPIGVHNDVDIKTYHADTNYYSSSGLRLARRSLKLFKLFMDGKVDATGKLNAERQSHFDFGNAFELALLDPEAFAKEVIYYDEMKRPEPTMTMGSTANRDWKASIFNTDKYVINRSGDKESFDVIEEMLSSCYQDAVIQKLLTNIEYQSSIFWRDESGLLLKTRPDVCKTSKNVIIDVKTTIDGSPEKFNRDIANYAYPFQATMQIDGVLKSGYMNSVDAYYWLVVEKEPPYSATLYEFAPEDQEWAFEEYRYILDIVARAIKENKFPSYSQRADNRHGILRAEIPLWYRTI